MPTEPTFLFDTKLSSLDPDVDFFIQAEEERQRSNLLMIPSESLCPRPVRDALTVVFGNKYAEGYPPSRMSIEERARIEKEPERYLAFHRRYGDRRFYKGAEYCNFIEVLAQRRAAEIFANPNAALKDILVNVQPLSGAAANNAVYNAFLTPGDTIMGMSLSYGGHLTHGSPFNRSGRQYKVIHYTVDPLTGKFDYDLIEQLALEHKPRIIIGGASAYPWAIDWSKLKSICEKVPVQIPGLNQTGALLLADISHPSGLVVAGLFPNPVGIADVTTLTTHKTLCGPRGAIIISTDEQIAKRIDLGVFPGEQGGPHLNNILAKAVCFKIASTQTFKNLQKKIVENCRLLAAEFQKLGLTLAYGGTNTHMVLIDLGAIKTSSCVSIKGDIASDILDLCGITCNKNALPGDETGARPRGIRFGTTILTQLGMGKNEMRKIAGLIHHTLTNIQTFTVISHSGEIVRGKIDIEVMEKVRNEVDKLLKYKPTTPLFPLNKGGRGVVAIEIIGERATAFLQSLVTGNLYLLKPGEAIKTLLKVSKDCVDVTIKLQQPDTYIVIPPKARVDNIFRYFKGLSDGYITWSAEGRSASGVTDDDIYAKVEGPVVVRRLASGVRRLASSRLVSGQRTTHNAKRKTEFVYQPYTGESRKTALYEEHQKLTKPQFIVPFAGWSMPLWYTRASEEHQAVRSAAGLFDVSHMGKLDISGPYATRFLDLVTTNYVPKLKIGQSHYSYILDPDGNVMDDILLYRLSQDNYLMVVNAVNTEKIKQWLNAVNNRQVIIDRNNPDYEIEDIVRIVDRSEKDVLVNIALQGPLALNLLLRLSTDKENIKNLKRLKKTHFIWTELGKTKALVARTGYTGEDIAFEIFVSTAGSPVGATAGSPVGAKEDATHFWNLLLEAGKDLGLKPCGLAARDSLRTEAGLPLYGHELAGEHSITPTEAGYGAFIKRHKPFFIGRKNYLKKEKTINNLIVRFKVTTPNARAIKTGDAVLESPLKRGDLGLPAEASAQAGVCKDKIGLVTSCVLVPSLEAGGQNSQIGLALIEKKYAIENRTLNIITTPRPGSQIAHQSVQSIILTRFMVKG